MVVSDCLYETYKKPFEKLWSDHVKTLSSSGTPVKQSAVIRLKEKEEDALPISKILIKLKVNTFDINSWPNLKST